MAMRIWVLHMAFTKNGFPSIGSFGHSMRGVVIVPIDAWTQLCREIPALAIYQFDVGGENDAETPANGKG